VFIRLVAWTPFSLMEYALGVDMDEKFFLVFFTRFLWWEMSMRV
jgi:hypothetical protein